MNDQPVEDTLPPIGAFPGYKFGRKLFVTFMNAMEEQANIWNSNWSKFISGDYAMKDYYQALSKSIGASTDAFEQVRLELLSGSSPPWVTLAWPPGGASSVRLKQAIDGYHQLSLRLVLLEQPEQALEASVKMTSAYSVAVTLKPVHQPADGTYVGFLVSDRAAEPLAIATVQVRNPSVPPISR